VPTSVKPPTISIPLLKRCPSLLPKILPRNESPNIERTVFESFSDEFSIEVAQKPEEIRTLLETGFECLPKGQPTLLKKTQIRAERYTESPE
jgi:hypothetical protein